IKRKIDLAEARLDELNAILPRLDAALATPGLYEADVARAVKLQKERAALIAAIAGAEDALLAAMDAYEQAKTQTGV
ncbi:MAG: hypothetical protein KDE05_07585, partial [Parvularculaceae bacterium]|nr:hypothetical protein [Parvularculaceae bacterium]